MKTSLVVFGFLLPFLSSANSSANTKELSNSHGWSISYPSEWNAGEVAGDQGPEVADHVQISGPPDCWIKNRWCASFEIKVTALMKGDSPRGEEILIDGIR